MARRAVQDLYALFARFAAAANPETAGILGLPSTEELIGVVTRAQVFGSEEVSELTTRWLDLYSEPEGETEVARDKRVEASRETMLEIRSAIRRELGIADGIIRSELTSNT